MGVTSRTRPELGEAGAQDVARRVWPAEPQPLEIAVSK